PIHRNTNYHADGTKSLIYLYHKHDINPTTPSPYHRNNNNILLGLQDDGTPTSVSADDKENDPFYTCLIQLGTLEQTVQMNFDSASADTWVRSTAIPDANDVPNETIFDPL
ncbi:uncharacterized protein A1O5_12520, partial [Cladophialophora psammophila CBS 110553]